MSAYGINIYDPGTLGSTPPALRQQFANNVIPQGRLSSQTQALLKLIPLPNRPGTENGTRDNFVASGTEPFNNNSIDVRLDDRVSDRLNVFGRYSVATFDRNGPTAFGAGGGQELVSLGGSSKVKNHSLALGFDRSIGSKMTADFRFGWFKYKVDVLPFDFGTTPAKDAGIPGLNLDSGFTSGLFGGFVEGGFVWPGVAGIHHLRRNSWARFGNAEAEGGFDFEFFSCQFAFDGRIHHGSGIGDGHASADAVGSALPAGVHQPALGVMLAQSAA